LQLNPLGSVHAGNFGIFAVRFEVPVI